MMMYPQQQPATVVWQHEAEVWLPRILGALAILVVAYILARAAKWGIAKLVDRIPALQRHNEAEPGKTLGSLIGDIAFWLILLVGILLALQPLGLSQVLEPVRQLTTNAFAFIPNVIAAGLIFFIGLVIAKIAKRVVETALLAANADGWLRRTGLMETAGTAPAMAPEAPATATAPGRPSISRSVGLIVFFLIMIPVTIAALDALGIAAISVPATEMLNAILLAIPNVLGALILLAIGYMVGRLAKSATEQILPSMGFDRAVSALGVSPESTTPSRTAGMVVMVAILLFSAIKAAELLQSPIIAVMLAQVLELGSRILFGTGIILGGVIIARIVSNLVRNSGTEGWLPAILKWSIISLAVAMGLRFMGLANEIVIIAFASIIGSAAIACALAFGLGGRPTAHKLLEEWTAGNRLPKAPQPPRAPTAPVEDRQPPLV
ncbi:mechanosensitive ion channel [Allosphingosinicella flava]|uniref:Small-conductance mechanosensitive channel n=1 Tax=Allosphingosinicella flava TaxID=2771430 RepID=A0A7T2LN10_9SPHN|nr:mechanosensitive ion channel [Sphingosinicella flava]QPQ56110.1 mechanosensitive ion channel [Sphingosinicella flava]